MRISPVDALEAREDTLEPEALLWRQLSLLSDVKTKQREGGS